MPGPYAQDGARHAVVFVLVEERLGGGKMRRQDGGEAFLAGALADAAGDGDEFGAKQQRPPQAREQQQDLRTAPAHDGLALRLPGCFSHVSCITAPDEGASVSPSRAT